MFNVLISADNTAWETDQLMRMDITRFKEYSDGAEAATVSTKRPDSLKALESIPALLMYETGTDGPNADLARYGYVFGIRVTERELVFRFREEGRFPIAVVREYADRLGFGRWEQNRTHWALKDGGIPKGMLAKLQPSYDIVLSFAGEDRKYVERVAMNLRSHGVSVFYDTFEEAKLWGKDLAEHLDLVYRRSGDYCVVFISKHYAEKMWTRHERRSALARALEERREYILPARIDTTQLPGIPPTVGFIPIAKKRASSLAKLILEKLGKPSLKPETKKHTPLIGKTRVSQKLLDAISKLHTTDNIKNCVKEVLSHPEYPLFMSVAGNLVRNPIWDSIPDRQREKMLQTHQLTSTSPPALMHLDMLLIRQNDSRRCGELLTYFSKDWKTHLLRFRQWLPEDKPELRLEMNAKKMAKHCADAADLVEVIPLPDKFAISVKPHPMYGDLFIYVFEFCSVVFKTNPDFFREKRKNENLWFNLDRMRRDASAWAVNADVIRALHELFTVNLGPLPVSFPQKTRSEFRKNKRKRGGM